MSMAVIFGRAKPSQKKAIVREFKKINYKDFYQVGFVGDGFNDSEALIEADVGLSLGN